MDLKLGSHPTTTQIVDALAYVGGYPHCRAASRSSRSIGENYSRRPLINLNAYLMLT